MDRLRALLLDIVRGVVANAVFVALASGVATTLWGALISLDLPVLVALFVAVTGGILGGATYVERAIPPRPLEVASHGLLWIERAGSPREVVPLCPVHRLEVMGRNGSAPNNNLFVLQVHGVIETVYCVEGHEIDLDISRLEEAFAAGRFKLDRRKRALRIG